MSQHIDIDTLSAYLDGELSEGQRARVDDHLAGCDRCASQRLSLQRGASAVAALPKLAMTSDEHRSLRTALLNAKPSAKDRRSPRAAWALAGGLGLVLLGAVSFFTLRPSTPPAIEGVMDRPPATDFDFDSGHEVEAAAAALPEVSGRLEGGKSNAATAERAAEGGGEDAPAPAAAPLPRDTSRTAEATTGGQGTAGDGSDAEFAQHKEESRREDAGDLDFSAEAGQMCLAKVAGVAGLGSEPRVPLAAREARFQGIPSWLLVYDLAARNRIEVWLVPPGDCLIYSGKPLLERALYHSSFDSP